MTTLKELRGQRFITQAELAKKAGIGRDTVNQVERGKHKPSFLTIRKLAAALGIEPGQIEFPNLAEKQPETIVQPTPLAESAPSREGEPPVETKSSPAEVEKPSESDELPPGWPPDRLANAKCQKCGERVRAEFRWANPEHSDLWLAECPKCGGLLVLTRPKWAPPQTSETEANL